MRGTRQYSAEIPGLLVTVIQTGMGLQRAKSSCRQAFREGHYDLVISAGFAGAIIPSSIGDLVLPNTVVLKPADGHEYRQLPSFSCSVEYQQLATRVIQEIQISVLRDALVTVPTIVWADSEKRSLARRYRASAIDMESAGLAEIAQEQAAQFMVIRTVSDLMNESLPEDFTLFLSPSTWMQGLWRFVSRPEYWPQLLRLRQQTNIASQHLTTFLDKFLQSLRQETVGESKVHP